MIEKSLSKEEKFVVNLGIVLNKEGKVLIVKRKKPELTKTGKEFVWAFPGGKQRKEESREERVVEEVLLETGYKVKPIKEIHLRVHPDTYVLIIYHLCELVNEEPIAEIQEKDEIEEAKWVKPEELKNYFTTDIDPEVKKVLGI